MDGGTRYDDGPGPTGPGTGISFKHLPPPTPEQQRLAKQFEPTMVILAGHINAWFDKVMANQPKYWR